jgi:hypothetical protein
MNQKYMGERSIHSAAGAALSVPSIMARFISRLVHLKPGRYMITLSVYSDRCDWTISETARIESSEN